MGGDPIPGPFDVLRDRFLRAKGPREQYQFSQRKWKVTHCLACGKRVEYVPKDQFNGTLKCPHCGVRFKVPSLNGFFYE